MLIKNHLAELVKQAIVAAQADGALPAFAMPDVFVERPQRKEWGDFSTSVSLKLARDAKRAPLQIAQVIAAHVPADKSVAKVDASAPGFVNFTLSPAWIAKQVDAILEQGAQYGNLECDKRLTPGNISDEIILRIEQLYPIYEFLSWSPKNDYRNGSSANQKSSRRTR